MGGQERKRIGDIAEHLEELELLPVLATQDIRYGIHRASADVHYRPTLASREEASMLRIGRESPLIEERRVSYYRPAPLGQEFDAPIPYEYLFSLYTNRASLDFSWSDFAALSASCETLEHQKPASIADLTGSTQQRNAPIKGRGGCNHSVVGNRE